MPATDPSEVREPIVESDRLAMRPMQCPEEISLHRGQWEPRARELPGTLGRFEGAVEDRVAVDPGCEAAEIGVAQSEARVSATEHLHEAASQGADLPPGHSALDLVPLLVAQGQGTAPLFSLRPSCERCKAPSTTR